MGNVIKVRLKKTIGVGIAGVTTTIFEAGTEGFVVDAAPVVKEGNITADILVLFPERAHASLFSPNELEVVETPTELDNSKVGLVSLIADMVALSFEMHDQGVDLSYLSGIRRNKPEKPQAATEPEEVSD